MARFVSNPSASAQKASEEQQLTPSQITRLYFKLANDQGVFSFSFKGRRYLIDVYDTDARNLLLLCGRQVTKSTLLGNQMLAYGIAIKHLKELYVSPTQQQTHQFVRDRLRTPILLSPYLKAHVRPGATDSYDHLEIGEGSEIRLRHSYLNADRIRGIQADAINIDEVQDIDADNIPVIEQTLFTSKRKLKKYSGTPKTEDNTLSQLWFNESTQNEWLVPCHRHRFKVWNLPGEENLPAKASDGLVCRACKKSIDPMDEMAHWASMNPHPSVGLPFAGYRIPQIIDPNADWVEILNDYRKIARKLFFNERLGLPYEAAMRPITRAEIMQWCHPQVSMTQDSAFQYNLHWAQEMSRHHAVFMGVDWGQEGPARTYVTLGSYFGGDKIRVFYAQPMVGANAEPQRQLATIDELVQAFNVRLIGSDYGGGFDRNDVLLRRYGAERVHRFQYSDISEKLRYDPELGRFMVKRTEILSDIFQAIKRGVYLFPRWEEMDGEMAQEILNVFTEHDERRDIITYSHAPKMTDDGFHSLNYLTLVSCIPHPRPDIFVPGVFGG